MSVGSVTVSPRYLSYRTQPGCTSCNQETASSTDHESSQIRRPENTAHRTSTSPNELTPEEQQQVAELKKRDREVKAHEAAHMAAGGAYVRGGASYSYQSGPDGKRYAVGGEVSIDTSPEDDPAATIRKMQTVRSAALAPANPSGQDRSVAAAAAAQEAQARQELRSEQSRKTGNEQPGKPERKTGSYTPSGEKQINSTGLQRIDYIA